MAEVFVEMVNWNREDIKHTALRIVGFYTQSLQHLGTSRWAEFATRIIPVSMGESSPYDVKLVGDAFELIFQPPRPTLIPHIKDGTVTWEQREPGFIFRDSTFMNLAPRFRNLLYRVNEAIAEEAADTYRIRIERNPFSFLFPKNEYGRVEVDRAVLLERR